MDKFHNMIRMHASLMQNSISSTQLAIVTAYDPVNYAVQVQTYAQDDDTNQPLVTGWIPLFTPWMGNGWGLYLPPNLGDLIEVHYQEGSLQNGYAGLRCFNPTSPAGLPSPNGVPSGEFWLIHQTGSYIKVTNDGKVSINGQAEIDIIAPVININGATQQTITTPILVINASTSVTVNSPVATVNAATSATLSSPEVNLGNGTLQALINASALALYNGHIHVDSTGHNTSAPLTGTWNSAQTTTNTQAS